MKADDKHMSLSDFIQNEIKTLGFIAGLTGLRNHFPSLFTAAEMMYHTYSGSLKKSAPTNFSFGVELEMRIEGRKMRLFVEAKIEDKFSLATYALSICDPEALENILLRKFHFDYDPQCSTSRDKKPLYHLQYGGTQTPKLKENEIDTRSLHDWISVPRLSIFPINLALFFDMIFKEFPSTETSKVSEAREWRNFIKENEEKVLIPYYLNINRFITSGNHRSTRLFRDFLYGE